MPNFKEIYPVLPRSQRIELANIYFISKNNDMVTYDITKSFNVFNCIEIEDLCRLWDRGYHISIDYINHLSKWRLL